MNEDNMIFKTNEFSIEISPVGKAIQAKDIQYFSYDENSGLQLIHILMDGKPLDLPNGTEIRLSAVKLNNQNQKLIYTPEIVDPLKGIVSFIIPREFLGYQGQIRCGLYINFSNNQTMHVGYFYINMGVSDIDTNLTEFTEDFWQGWSEFEASSTAKMQELEQRIDEQTEIFNNADVYNKAEIEDKLEPFALRTDIDTLEIKKADKIALAETDAEVAELDSSKADKTALASTNQTVNSLVSSKVDKGGNEQITMTMLSQPVKEAMTGGSVAVVGTGAVNTTNIVDNAVTKNKLGFPQKMEFLSSGSMKIDIPNRTILIADRSVIETVDGNYIYISDGTGLSTLIPETTNPTVYFYVDTSSSVMTLNRTNTPSSLNSKCVIVAVIFNDVLRYPIRFENIEFIGSGVTSPKTGEIIGNPIYVDAFAKTIKIPQKTYIRSENSYYTYEATTEMDLSFAGNGSVSLFYNHQKKEFKVKSNSSISGTYSWTMNENNLVLIASLFEGKVFKAESDSNIVISNAKNTETEISYLLDDLVINETTKQVTIPKNFKFMLNTSKSFGFSGRDYFTIAAQTLAIPEIPNALYVWHLYLNLATKLCRVGFYKENANEVLIVSWWDGNVIDTLSPNKVIYNNIRGGSENAKVTTKNMTLSEISNGLAKGEISTLCFYGDSTYEGATNGDPTNAFSALLGPMLTEEFGKTINVINGGHGGKSIGWLDTNFDTYFGAGGEYTSAQVVIIGGGLNNAETADSINGNKKSLQSIITKLKKMGKEVVIATTQATCLTLYTADQTPHYGRNQWGVYAYENSMRRDLAKENDLALLDFNTITSQFIMFSKHLETEICYDRLHFSDLGHKFEAGWLCSQLINRTITIDDRFLITPATHNIQSDVEWHSIESLTAVDANGFKSQIKLEGLADGTLIYDTLIFNASKKPMQLKCFVDGGEVSVTINDGTPITLNTSGQVLSDMEMGYYHIQVKATGTTGNFKGLVFE